MSMNIEEATKAVIRSAVNRNVGEKGFTEVNEASLSHIVGKQTSGYCIVSACHNDWNVRKREEFDRGDRVKMPERGNPNGDRFVDKESGIAGELQKAFDDNAYWNRAMTQELKADLRRRGIGYVPVYGGFREGDTDVEETSFILVPMTANREPVEWEKVKNAAIELGIKYGQDSVAICPPDEAPYFYVTREYEDSGTKFKVGDEQRWFKRGMKLNDITQLYFTSLNKVHEHPSDGKGATVKRFSFIGESMHFGKPAASYQIGHLRWAQGELFQRER